MPEGPDRVRVLSLSGNVPLFVVVMDSHPGLAFREASILAIVPLTYKQSSAPMTHLDWRPSVVSGGLPEIDKNVAHIRILLAGQLTPVRSLSLKVLDGLNVLVLLLGPVSGDVAQTHLLSLIDKECSGERTVEHGEKFAALGSVIWVIRRNSRDGSGLIVVLETRCQ